MGFNVSISFKTLPSFGQQGFSFIYQSDTRPYRKLSARAVHGNFVGMESDSTLYRIYVTSWKRIVIVRKQDFRWCHYENLPGVSALIYWISKQRELEDRSDNENGIAEELPAQAFTECLQDSFYFSPQVIPQNHSAKQNLFVPRSFRDAIKDPQWCNAVDREYNVLKSRSTWSCLSRNDILHAIPCTWVFRLQPIENKAAPFP